MCTSATCETYGIIFRPNIYYVLRWDFDHLKAPFWSSSLQFCPNGHMYNRWECNSEHMDHRKCVHFGCQHWRSIFACKLHNCMHLNAVINSTNDKFRNIYAKHDRSMQNFSFQCWVLRARRPLCRRFGNSSRQFVDWCPILRQGEFRDWSHERSRLEWPINLRHQRVHLQWGFFGSPFQTNGNFAVTCPYNVKWSWFTHLFPDRTTGQLWHRFYLQNDSNFPVSCASVHNSHSDANEPHRWLVLHSGWLTAHH